MWPGQAVFFVVLYLFIYLFILGSLFFFARCHPVPAVPGCGGSARRTASPLAPCGIQHLAAKGLFIFFFPKNEQILGGIRILLARVQGWQLVLKGGGG